MDEIEVKVIEEDFTLIRKQLIKLGAKKTFSGKFSTIYLDTSDLKFKNEKKVLRVREGKKNVITFKETVSEWHKYL